MTRDPAADKDRGIQSLRGIAVLLMVAGHVIGADPGHGLAIADDSGWRFFYRALEDSRMPLFTVLSGYVYALRPVGAPAGMRRLVRGKVRRLLAPLVVVGTIFFFAQLTLPGVRNRPSLADLPRVYLVGYEYLWFLQAIFLIFVVVGLLDAYGALRTFRSWSLVLAAAFVLFVLVRVPSDAEVFSVNGAIRLLPFFLLGYGALRYADQLLQPRFRVLLAAVLVPVYGLRLWTIAAEPEWSPVPTRALSLAVGVLTVVTLLAVRRHLVAPLLVWMGGFSYGIYLLHTFGSSGSRLLIGALGIESVPSRFAVALVAGVTLPILFELTLGRFTVVSWAVLGQRPRRPAAPLDSVETRSPTGDAVS